MKCILLYHQRNTIHYKFYINWDHSCIKRRCLVGASTSFCRWPYYRRYRSVIKVSSHLYRSDTRESHCHDEYRYMTSIYAALYFMKHERLCRINCECVSSRDKWRDGIIRMGEISSQLDKRKYRWAAQVLKGAQLQSTTNC